MGLAEEEFADLIPAQQLTLVWEEPYPALQGLIDLGYFTLRQNQSEKREHYLSKAVKRFRDDLLLAGNRKAPFHEHSLSNMTVDEIDLLEELSSFDNPKAIAPYLMEGQTNLYSRVLHYRLNLYGFAFNVRQPFGADSLAILDQINSLIPSAGLSRLDLIDMLDEPKKLCALLLKEASFENRLIYFKSRDKKVKRKIDGWVNVAFRKRLKAMLSREEYKKFFSASETAPHRVTTKIKTPVNVFLVRLLQIRLWMLGYYEGKIDNDFSILTIEALDDFLDDEDIKFNSMVLELKTGRKDKAYTYGVLNAEEILSASMDNAEKSPADLTALGTLYEKQVANNPQGHFEDNLNEQLQKLPEESRKNLSLGRRIYLGISGIAKGIFRGLKKIAGLFKKMIKKALAFIRKLARLLYVEAAKALKVFFTGISFLLGKRRIITIHDRHMISSRYHFDFDQVSLASKGVGDRLIQKHQDQERFVIESMPKALKVVSEVIKWISRISKLSTPVGWVSLVLQIIKILKDLLVEKKRSLSFI